MDYGHTWTLLLLHTYPFRNFTSFTSRNALDSLNNENGFAISRESVIILGYIYFLTHTIEKKVAEWQIYYIIGERSEPSV